MKYLLKATALARILTLFKNGQFVVETVIQEQSMILPLVTLNLTATVARLQTTRRCQYLLSVVTDLLERSRCLYQHSVSAWSAALYKTHPL